MLYWCSVAVDFVAADVEDHILARADGLNRVVAQPQIFPGRIYAEDSAEIFGHSTDLDIITIEHSDAHRNSHPGQGAFGFEGVKGIGERAVYERPVRILHWGSVGQVNSRR